MAKKLRRAFTIVELVIVIAVIAILAAVLIPTFTSLIQKANVSNDTQIVREMNTALSMGEADGRPEDMGDVLNVLSEYGGFDMAKLNPSTDGYLYVWEKTSNQILLMDDKGAVAFNVKDYDESNWELYVPVANTQTAEAICAYVTEVGVYVSEDMTYDFNLKNVVPFQVADGKTLTGNVTMVGTNAITTSVSGNIVGTLTIDNANAEVSHAGTINAVDIKAVKSSSYHEYGTVKESFAVSNGRVVIEESANVSQISVPADATNVKIQSNSLQNIVVVAESSDVVLENGTGKLFLDGSAADAVADKNQNSESMVTKTVVSDLATLKSVMQQDAYVFLSQNLVFDTADIITIPAGVAVVLDMNGKSITCTESFNGRPFINEGTMTIKGNGTIDTSMSTVDGLGAVNNKGYLLIENGTFRGMKYAGGSVIRNTGTEALLVVNDGTFEGAVGAIYNEGKATLNGGNYIGETCSRCNSSSWAYTIRNVLKDSYMVINGGTYTGIQGAVSASIGTLIVNDGYFKSVACETHGTAATFYALYAAGEYGEVRCIINGGTFETEGRVTAVSIGNDNTGGDGVINAQATAEIYGGTFIAPEGVPAIIGAKNTGDPIIFGGKFTSEILDRYLISGYVCVEEDGYYVVKAQA